MADFDKHSKNSGLLSSKGADILRARSERISQISSKEEGLFKKIAQDDRYLQDVVAEIEAGMMERYNKVQQISARIDSMKKAAEGMRQGRTQQANLSFASEMRGVTSSTAVNQDISSITRAFETYGPSLSMAQTMSSTDMHRQQRTNRSLLEQQTATLGRTDMGAAGGAQSFMEQLNRRQETIGEIGVTQAAIAQQRRMGLDLMSQHQRASKLTGSLQEDMENKQIRRDVSAGGFNRSQVENRLEEVTKSLIETFGKLDEAVKTSSDGAEDLAKQFDVASKEYFSLQRTSSAIASIGGGGNWTAASSMLNMGGSALSSAGGITRYAGVTSEITQMQNQRGLAEIENRRFFDRQAAASGDAAALRRIRDSQLDTSKMRGQEIGQVEFAAMGLDMAGAVANTAGGLIDSMGAVSASVAAGAGSGVMIGKSPLGAKVGAGVGLLTGLFGVASRFGNDGSAAAQLGINIGKNLSVDTARIQGTSESIMLADTRSAVSDTQYQMSIDYLRGAAISTRGAGSRRETMLNEAIDPAQLTALQRRTGLDLSEINRLTEMGQGALGAGFDRTADIGRGGELARTGYFQSADQYMGARSQLTNVGGSSDNLEEILKSAVATGMDNSKNILQMVGATERIASASAATGASTAIGAIELMGKSADAMSGLGVHKDLRANVARTAIEYADSHAAQNRVTIGGIIQSATLRREFQGADTLEQAVLQRTDLSTITTLEQLKQSKNKKGYDDLLHQKGLSGIDRMQYEGDGIAALRKSYEERMFNEAIGGGFIGAREKQERYRKNMAAGTLDKDDVSFMNQLNIAAQTGVFGGATTGLLSKEGAGKRALRGTKSTGTSGAAEDMLAAPGEFGATAFRDTAAALGARDSSFKGLMSEVATASRQGSLGDGARTSTDAKQPIGEVGKSFEELNKVTATMSTTISETTVTFMALKDTVVGVANAFKDMIGGGKFDRKSSIPSGKAVMRDNVDKTLPLSGEGR